jgi:hypothetical protein
MSEFEDLNAKAARLWLEFMQAQAKAAASAAARLPEVTRSLAEAGVPLAAEVNRWLEGTRPAKVESAEVHPPQASHEEAELMPPAPVAATLARKAEIAPPLTRANHRRLKMPTSMSRRRTRRA